MIKFLWSLLLDQLGRIPAPKISEGIATEVTLAKLNGFSMPVFDSIYPTFATTTDTYAYKLAAATVATITITYVDSTKEVIQSIVRT